MDILRMDVLEILELEVLEKRILDILESRYPSSILKKIRNEIT